MTAGEAAPTLRARMAVVGRVSELWRYPVKSMGGERRERYQLGPRGIVGDRGWAVRDETAGEIRGAKKLPALLRCSATYVAEPTEDTVPPAEIALPDARRVRTDDPAAATHLSELVGRPVTLWARQPPTAREHYRRAAPDNPDLMAELRQIFGRIEDEPLPDLSVFPAELMEFTSPSSPRRWGRTSTPSRIFTVNFPRLSCLQASGDLCSAVRVHRSLVVTRL